MNTQFEQTNPINQLNQEKYREIKRLVVFNSTPKMIKQLIAELGTNYLSQSDPNITDWGKTFPRYLHILGVCFGDGHPLFTLLRKSFSLINIELTDFDILYMTIAGVFWRYYNNRSIVNHAINELKKSDIYPRITNIPYTPAIAKLLEDSSVTKSYPTFNRYGTALGYFNVHWLIDPSTYNNSIDCRKVDALYEYSISGSIFKSEEELAEEFGTNNVELNVANNNYSESNEWHCIVQKTNKNSWYSSTYYIFLQGEKINKYMTEQDDSYVYTINSLKPEDILTLQEHGIIPELSVQRTSSV